MARPTDLLQGTLDLLILKSISLEPRHGWAIAKRIQQVSQDALQVQQGSLYPALHRLEQQAWIQAEWRPRESIRLPPCEPVGELRFEVRGRRGQKSRGRDALPQRPRTDPDHPGPLDFDLSSGSETYPA
jgi:hypothetical protein